MRRNRVLGTNLELGQRRNHVRLLVRNLDSTVLLALRL
jgi:hypothetical protein